MIIIVVSINGVGMVTGGILCVTVVRVSNTI